MKKNIFSKHFLSLIVVLAVCAGIVGYSFLRSNDSGKTFVDSGYVHTSLSESEGKKILFSSGTKFSSSFETVRFSDIDNVERKLDTDNFIHYDNAVSSFVDGVIVNLDALSNDKTINHYHVSSGTALVKNGSTYQADSNGEINFSNFIWKLNENKYLIVSDSLSIHISEEDVRTADKYIEVTYLDGSVIQIQTEDNIWQTISSNCFVSLKNDSIVNLSMKNIEDKDQNVLLDFSRIVIDSDDNLELTPLTDDMETINKNIIPHFTVDSEPGEDGTNGTSGTTGYIGADGNSGLSGKQGLSGSSESIDGNVLNFPVFTVNDWEVGPTSCKGSISVSDPSFMLVDESGDLFSKLYLVDLSSGENIYMDEPVAYKTPAPGQFDFKGIANDPEAKIEFNFKNLLTDHSYMLYASSPLQPDKKTDEYSRQFIAKTFWTDSLGVYLEADEIETNKVTLAINKSADTYEKVKVYYPSKLYTDLGEISSLTLDEIKNGGVFNQPAQFYGEETVCKVSYNEDIYSNTEYYAVLAYDTDGDGIIDDYSSQILVINTLKIEATIGSPILKANRNSWGFDIVSGPVNDPDGGIKYYTYEFYNEEDINEDGTLVENAKPVKTAVTDRVGSITVSIDNDNLRTNTAYRIRTIATFYDNQKEYTITSGFSASAQVTGAMEPTIFFEQNSSASAIGGGTSGRDTTSPYYETITGVLHVTSGSDGSKMLLDPSFRRTQPRVVIEDESTYHVEYPIYLSSEITGKEKGTYLVGYLETNGDIRVIFPDYQTSDYSWVSGLKPGWSYRLTVYGDLSEDGTIVSNEDVEVGHCTVHTPNLEELTVYSSYDPKDDNDVFKSSTFAFDVPEERSAGYEREKASLYTVTFDIYANDCTDETKPLPTSKLASKTFTREEPWVNAIGQKVATYYDSQVDAYKDGVQVVEFNTTIDDVDVTTFLLAEYGVAANPQIQIRDSENQIVTSEMIDKSAGTKYIVYSNILDKLFSNAAEEDELPDGRHDWKVTNGGLMISENDFTQADFYNITTIPDPGFTIVMSKTYDYTANPQDKSIQNHKQGGQVVTYKNEIPVTGEKRLYVKFTQNIPNVVLEYPYNYLIRENDNPKVDYDYLMQAKFSNSSLLADSITYYVYDAVDFYKGSYGRTADGELLTWAKSTVATEDNEKSILLDETSPLSYPVTQEGLELGKVTIDMSGNPNTPSAVFYPYSKEEYKQRNESPTAPTLDGDGNAIIYFNEDGLETYGHQYVFCWTINYHEFMDDGSTGYHLVYPFDANVRGTRDEVTETIPFKNFVTQDNTPIPYDQSHCKEKVYGTNAYMLIPHAEITSDNQIRCDEPKVAPVSYALRWSSDKNSVTTKAFILDPYKSVYSYESGGLYVTKPWLATSNSSCTQLNTEVAINFKEIEDKSNDSYEAITNYAAMESFVQSDADTKVSGFSDTTKFKVSDIVIQRSDLNDVNTDLYDNGEGSAVLVMPIQLYVDKYTEQGVSLHAGADNKYIEGSADGNWTFVTETGNTAKVKELCTVTFDNVYDYKADSSQYDNYQLATLGTDYFADSDPQRLGLYERGTSKALTNDEMVIPGKDYFETQSSSTPVTVDYGYVNNPRLKGWYEYSSYNATEDTLVKGGKQYYVNKAIDSPLTKVMMDIMPKETTTGGETKTSAFYVEVYGPKEQLKDAVGVRLTFEQFDENDYSICTNRLSLDKYLQTGIAAFDVMSQKATGEQVKLKEYTCTDADGTGIMNDYLDKNQKYIKMYFMVDLKQDLASAVSEFGNEGFAGSNIPVVVSGQILYETDNSGFKYLKYHNDSSDDYYSLMKDNTFALKNVKLKSNISAGGIEYYTKDMETYEVFASSPTNFDSANQYYTVNGGTSAYSLDKFGSFLQMYGRIEPTDSLVQIATRSTRYWNVGAAKAVDVNTKVDVNNDNYVPVRLETSGKIMARLYVSGYDDPSTNKTLSLPKVPITINNYSSKIDKRKAEIDYQLIGTSSVDAGKIYFTVTQGNRTYAINPKASETLNVLSFNDSNYAYKGTTTINSNAFATTTADTLDDVNAYFDRHSNLKDIMIPVAYNSSMLVLDKLRYDTQYTVTCWYYTDVGGGQYGFTPLYTTENDEEHPNFYSFRTGPITIPKANAVWNANSYTNKYLNYTVTNQSFDSQNCYYVVDLYKMNSSGTYEYLTHLYAGSDFNTNSFDATTKTTPAINKYFYDDDYISISNSNNQVTFSGDPQHIIDDIVYGGKYQTVLRLYDKGYGPAYNPTYDWDKDYDNLLKVFELVKGAGGNPDTWELTTERDFSVKNTFTVADALDTVNAFITTTPDIFSGNPEQNNISFVIPSITNRSYSLRYNKFTPVLIRVHVNDSGVTEYYDITNRIYNGNGSRDNAGDTYEHNGIYNFGSSLKIYTNYYDSLQDSYETYYDVGDEFRLFIYSYQDDTKQTLFIDDTNTLANLTAKKLLEDRYTVPTMAQTGTTTKDKGSKQITQADYDKLGPEYINMSNKIGSRKMAETTTEMKSDSLNVGNVTVSFNKSTGQMTVTMKNYVSGPSQFKSINYQISATYYSKTTTGITPDETYTGSLSKFDISDMYLNSSNPYASIINATSYLNELRSKMGSNGVIKSMQIVLTFNNKNNDELIDITRDDNDKKAIVSDNDKKITYSLTFEE